jgi:protein-disulfide isomerase
MGLARGSGTARRASAALVVVSALLAGCSGDGPAFPGLAAGAVETTSTDTSGSSSIFPDAAPAKGASAPPMATFGAIPDPSQGGRQVIENPTVAQIMEPGPLPEMSLGKPDAPVTIVQYASLTCPHCQAFHRETFPEFERVYIKTGKVRYILREFPIGKQSGNATVALRCAKPAKYFDLYAKFMAQQASWVSQEVRLDPIFAVAKQVGMTRAEFDACYQNQGMIDGLKWVKERGRTLGVIGTPNFFVQGKLVKKTLTMSDIREMVEPLLSAPKAASVAQEQR